MKKKLVAKKSRQKTKLKIAKRIKLKDGYKLVFKRPVQLTFRFLKNK